MPGQNVKRSGWLKRLFVLLAVSTSVFGVNIAHHHDFLVPQGSTWLSLLYTLLIIGLLTLGLLFLSDLATLAPGGRWDALARRRVDSRAFFCAVLLVNLLVLVAYYPGTGSWDTVSQLKDYFDGTSRTRYAEGGNAIITAYLNDHHPVATTLLFAMFANLGRLMDNERLGLFLYSALQIVLYAYAYTQALEHCGALGGRARWLAAAFYVLHPFLPYYAIMMLKDSLFAPLFLVYFLRFIDLCRTGEKPSARRALGFIALSVILPLTKKTGIYIVVLSNLALLILRLRTRRPSLSVLAAVAVPALISFIVLPTLVFPAFNIFPGGKQEVLATLLQQTARTGLDHPEAYSEKDVELLNRVFKYKAIDELYNYGKTDPVKNTYKLKSVTDEDLKAYYRLWLKTGLRHPITYLKATAGTCNGFFAPTTQLEVYRENHYRDVTEAAFPLALRGAIDAIYDFLMDLPGLNLLLYIVVYTWWIPLFATYRLIRRRGWGALVQMAPVYVTLLTLIVSPLSFSRYALPLVILTPVMLCEAFRKA